jgi:hypothetical protein
LLTAS